jgi:hypothetical protein
MKSVKTKLRCFAGRNVFTALVLPSLIFSAAACVKKGSKPPAASHASGMSSAMPSGPLDRCVALRGNGTHLISHLSGLAKITTRWGEIQALAGGSSSTISTFLYESILLNPTLKPLPPADKSKAIALLLKSVFGYAMETAASPEWSAVISLGELSNKITTSGVMALPSSDYKKAASALLTILRNDDVRNLVNPEIIAMLENSPTPEYKDFQTRVDEVKKSAASLTNLDASDPDVFVRPGILNFPQFVKLIGYVGDFYSSYGNVQPEMLEFLKSCGADTGNLEWAEISQKPLATGTCGTQFAGMVRNWRATRKTEGASRLMDPPGLGLRSIMITSEIDNPSALQKLYAFEEAYHKGQERNLGIEMDDVNFGYWLSPSLDQGTLAKWAAENADGKSKKAINLGQAKTWREILEKSPLEPSLGKYAKFGADEPRSSTNPGSLSLGGWADLHPVQVLKAAGCSKVIYLTRRTGETSFITVGPPFPNRKPSGLAELLGMKPSHYDAIYSLALPTSAYSKALVQADGVWCTHWNDFQASEQTKISHDSFSGPLTTKDQELLTWPEAIADRTPIPGCL